MKIQCPTLHHQPTGHRLTIKALGKSSESVTEQTADGGGRNHAPPRFLDHQNTGLPHGRKLAEQAFGLPIPDVAVRVEMPGHVSAESIDQNGMVPRNALQILGKVRTRFQQRPVIRSPHAVQTQSLLPARILRSSR